MSDHYVPSELFEARDFWGSVVRRPERLPVIDSLIASSDMANVWRAVEQQLTRGDEYDDEVPWGDAWKLLDAIFSANDEWDEWGQMTAREWAALYKRIARQARELAELTETSKRAGLAYLCRPDDAGPFTTRVRDSIAKRGRVTEGQASSAYFGVLAALPRTPDALRNLALGVESLASRAKGAVQPKSKNARARFLIGRLSDHFRKQYGAPLHGHVATIVNVLCKTDFTAESVRQYLKSQKR